MKRFAFSTRLCSTVLCLSFLAFPAFLPSPANAARIAVIVLSPQLGPWDRLTSTPRVTAEIYYLEYLGYKVYIMRGSVDNILLALAEPQVRAISYFGHAAYPSMENLDANSWRFKAFQFLQGQYIKQGLSQNDAYQWAGAESQNFGLELVRNHSCSSLANAGLAQQFFKPGGVYYGVKGSYLPCPSPFALLNNVSFILDEYRVPGYGASFPGSLRECETYTGEICGTWTWDGRKINAGWANGAKATLTLDRFDNHWVVISRNDTEGASAGLTALYKGRPRDNKVENGMVTWTWRGKTWSGTWKADWGTGQGGGQRKGSG